MSTDVPPAPSVGTLLADLRRRLHADYPQLPPEIIDRCVDDSRPFVRTYASNSAAYVAAIESYVRDEIGALAALVQHDVGILPDQRIPPQPDAKTGRPDA